MLNSTINTFTTFSGTPRTNVKKSEKISNPQTIVSKPENKNNYVKVLGVMGALAVAASVIFFAVKNGKLGESIVQGALNSHSKPVAGVKHKQRLKYHKPSKPDVLVSNKNRTLPDIQAANNKVEQVIANPPKAQTAKAPTLGRNTIIMDNIETSGTVRGKNYLEQASEEIITSQEQSAYKRKTQYKKATSSERKHIERLHEENARQSAELNSIGSLIGHAFK